VIADQLVAHVERDGPGVDVPLKLHNFSVSCRAPLSSASATMPPPMLRCSGTCSSPAGTDTDGSTVLPGHGLILLPGITVDLQLPNSPWFVQQLQPDQGGPERDHPDLGHAEVVRDRRGVFGEVVGRLAGQGADI
jgi:hypothetical protein